MTMRSSTMLGMMLAAAMGSAAVLGAQTTTAVDSAPYVQARDMVSNGEVEEGHRMVDSLLKAATPGTPAYAEGLYWRAAISQNARDAERDYRQVVVDYPLSSRVPDALLRLGQLEAARGDRDAALQHFQRVVLEYPDSPLRANASYWVANTYLAKNDLQRGCTANADALARVASTNVELKNRIDFQQLRCRGVQLATTTPAPTTVAPSRTTTTEKHTSATREVPVAESRASTDTPTVAAKAESTAVVARATDSATTAPAESTTTRHASSSKSVTKSVSTTRKVKTPKTAKAVAPPRSTRSTRVVKTVQQADSVKSKSAAESTAVSTHETTATTEATSATSTSNTSAAASGRGYAVQVAAYKSRVQADSLAAKLRARGYPSHVDGDTTPYRVRIGHYHTHADAAAVLKQLKAKKIDGFVTEF